MKVQSGEELINICKTKGLKIHEVMLEYEHNKTGKSKEEILQNLKLSLQVMRESVDKGLNSKEPIRGKLIGGDAVKIKLRAEKEKSVCGEIMTKAISYGLATMEVNASMGKIVACPTAGSCGILPAILLTVQEKHSLTDEELIQALLAASSVGVIIGKNACLSGAEGGCQAEVGSAAAMGAAGVVSALGGTPEQALHAAAMALKNLMGLVCDPIAGLVEAPCAKRNTIGAANGLICAEMALAGVESIVPFDEVVLAMYEVGKLMPVALRETSTGGLATTPTGIKLNKEIFK